MSKGIKIGLAVLSLALVCGPAASAAEEATISSDEMEILNNGAKTVFSGHVVLERPPYILKADRMTRVQPSGIVEAEGHIVGKWVNFSGEKAEARGERARYDPQSQIAELWTTPGRQVAINWEGPRGTGRFLGNRALLYVADRHAQLVQSVTGRVTPAPQ